MQGDPGQPRGLGLPADELGLDLASKIRIGPALPARRRQRRGLVDVRRAERKNDERAHVDDPTDAGRAGGIQNGPGEGRVRGHRRPVTAVVPVRGSEVDDRLHPKRRRSDDSRIGRVALDDLDRRTGPRCSRPGSVADDRADSVSRGDQLTDGRTTEEAGRAGDQDAHGRGGLHTTGPCPSVVVQPCPRVNGVAGLPP